MATPAVVIFAGPTISTDEITAELDAECRPPAAQGDVFLAARERPIAIGLIDGVFETVPAVWHKEILWALTQGIHVYGSSSIGALRAAEVAAFGMHGVGAIFEAYRDGTLTDDDEVALVHGPVETGYQPLSEPLVNIRATFNAAVAAGIVRDETARLSVSLAKELYYPERTFSRVISLAADRSVPKPELDVLTEWLPHGRVDLKRLDAIALVRGVRERLADGLEPKHVSFEFQWTKYWDRVFQGETVAAESRKQT
jgi:hypothetical protein